MDLGCQRVGSGLRRTNTREVAGGVERWVMVSAKDQVPAASRSHQTSLTKHAFKAMSIDKWATVSIKH